VSERADPGDILEEDYGRLEHTSKADGAQYQSITPQIELSGSGLVAKGLAGCANDEKIKIPAAQVFLADLRRIDGIDVLLIEFNRRMIFTIGCTGNRVAVDGGDDTKVALF
jgi:hypothetical protein